MNALKWCLNRPKQAKVMYELLEFAGMRDQPSHYKPLRDIQKKIWKMRWRSYQGSRGNVFEPIRS